MAEQQPPDASVSVDPLPISTTAVVAAAAAASTDSFPASSAYPTENPTNLHTISNIDNLGLGLAPKRQRRPSVRLGEIGHQSFDQTRTTQSRRPKNAYRFHKDPSLAAKTSKTRPLTNLVNGGDASNGNQDDYNNSTYDRLGKKTTTKKHAKRARINWGSSSWKYEAAPSNGGGGINDNDDENDAVYRDENHGSDDFRGVEAEMSDSQMKEQSPVQSEDNQNMGLHFWDSRATRARVSRTGSMDRLDNNHNINSNSNRNNGIDGIQDIHSGDENRSASGVGEWLLSLGLGRYAPVFEIHEVDDEVLPMLTLEDLKDMGINAVGSRRKMYAGILKMREGFS